MPTRQNMNLIEHKPDLELLLSSKENREVKHVQQELLKRIFAYFHAVHQVFHIEHPSSHTPIIVWMTQDIVFPDNKFQGPIPLLFTFPESFVIYDYRELNDERGVLESGSEKILSLSLRALLLQPVQVLTQLIQSIDARMAELQDQSKILQIEVELKKWEHRVGYDKSILVSESARHDNRKALQRLSELYVQYLGEFTHNDTSKTS